MTETPLHRPHCNVFHSVKVINTYTFKWQVCSIHIFVSAEMSGWELTTHTPGAGLGKVHLIHSRPITVGGGGGWSPVRQWCPRGQVPQEERSGAQLDGGDTCVRFLPNPLRCDWYSVYTEYRGSGGRLLNAFFHVHFKRFWNYLLLLFHVKGTSSPRGPSALLITPGPFHPSIPPDLEGKEQQVRPASCAPALQPVG